MKTEGDFRSFSCEESCLKKPLKNSLKKMAQVKLEESCKEEKKKRKRSALGPSRSPTLDQFVELMRAEHKDRLRRAIEVSASVFL